MSLSRYRFSRKIKNRRYYGTSNVNHVIYKAVKQGRVAFDTIILAEGQRLDHIAGITYENSDLWWVIAAASGIGYGLQVPPGTLINIPKNLNQIYNLL
jgi:hypothetical protein